MTANSTLCNIRQEEFCDQTFSCNHIYGKHSGKPLMCLSFSASDNFPGDFFVYPLMQLIFTEREIFSSLSPHWIKEQNLYTYWLSALKSVIWITYIITSL